MSSELQWLREQRKTPAEPRWAKNTLPPRCPTELVVTASRSKPYRQALYTIKDVTYWRETEIETATEWHWETREKGQDDG